MHTFTSTVALDPSVPDGYMKHYVAVPDAVADALAGTARLAGTLGQYAFKRTLHAGPHGACLKFGVGWLRDAGLSVGDTVQVTLGPDPDPDSVAVPDDVEAAFEAHPTAAFVWDNLTPGKRRTLLYPVQRAKRPDTRARRIAKLIESLRPE